LFKYHSFENQNIFKRTEFERTYKTCLYWNEWFFSFETNFERTLFDQTTYPDSNWPGGCIRLKKLLGQFQSVGGKLAGIIYKSFPSKTNGVILDFFFPETNPRNESFEHRRTKLIHEMNLLYDSRKPCLATTNLTRICICLLKLLT
jgi:hypothetical protein